MGLGKAAWVEAGSGYARWMVGGFAGVSPSVRFASSSNTHVMAFSQLNYCSLSFALT